MEEKICKKCDTSKSIKEFRSKTKNEKTYYENICRKCTYLKRKKTVADLKTTDEERFNKLKQKKVEQDKKQYNENKVRINERNNAYYKENRTAIRAQRKQFREDNPERVKAWSKKFLSDVNAKIGNNLRKRTRYFLHSGKAWSSLLGCDITHFKDWLEFNFEQEPDNDMNLNNYGAIWEIDHVYPLSKFDMSDEEDVKKAFNWKNILPALCSHNKSKNNKIVREDLDKLQERLKSFEEQNI